jgi:hypothetical protein
MPVQEVIWTALPRRVRPLALGLGQLELSVLVAPRLGTDAAAGKLSLAGFPDFVSWAQTVRGVNFSVAFEGGPSVPATRVSQPDPDLWASLFDQGTVVEPYRFTDLSATPVTSPPVPTAADALKGLWVLMASQHGASVPTAGQLNDVLTAAGARGGPAPAGGLPPPKPDPGAGPRPGGTTQPGYPGIHVGIEVGVDLGIGLGLDLGVGVGVGIGGPLPGVLPLGGATPRGPAGGPPPAPAPAAATQQLSRDDVKGSLDATAGAHAPLAHSPGGPPGADTLQQSLDFHRIVSVLAQHPDLLRRLGLVVDLQVPLLPAVPRDGSGRPQRVRVVPSWTPKLQTTINHSPTTAYVLDDRRFLPAPRPDGSELSNGLLRLNDPARFRVEQLDVDGGSRKVNNLLPTVDAILARLQAGEKLGTPEEAGLPTLRAAGIMVLHEDGAGGAGNLQNTAAPALKEKAQGMAALEKQLQSTKPAPGSGQSSQVGPLFAEQLTAGYRVDVWDRRTDTWHSLCARNAVYRFPDAPGAKKEVAIPGEGFVQRSASGSPGTALAVPAALFTWEGWSLCAPRPGRVLGLDSALDGDATTPPPPPPFGLDIESTPVRGSLPRLRFGRWYRMRARAVDVAGNSLALNEPPKDTPEASAAVLYSRMEPVASPVVVLTDLPKPGESVERLVVTSDPVAPPAGGLTTPSQRHIVAPKGSQLLAEAHGAFDIKGGMRGDRTGYDLARREKGSLQDDQHPPEKVGESEFTVRREAQLAVPWLPDPLAHGALLAGLPDVASDAFELGKNRVPFSGGWPNRASFRLSVVGVTGSAQRAQPVFSQTAAGRVLTVQLRPAETVTVQLSSYVDAGANLFLLGVWQWIEAAKPPNLEALRQEASRGRNWLLMPPRPLVLVHAVQRPLRAPQLDDWAVSRPLVFGETTADVEGEVDADGPSTAKVDVTATWVDEVDVPTEPRSKLVDRSAHLAEVPVPEGLGRLLRARLYLGDTRRHRVRCRAEATTRFREYFDQAMETSAFLRPAPNEAPVVTQEFDLPATARPAAPVVRHVLPTFTWSRAGRSQGSDVVFSSVRQCRGFRVYLERPWYSSGEGERLGVVFVAGEPLPPDDPRAPLITAWAADPLWDSDFRTGGMAPEVFPGATLEDGLTLEELPAGEVPEERRRVSVASFPVEYDEQGRAFADVSFQPHPVPLQVTYFPFVRLALARYQPNALKVDGADCNLSRVVVTDFVQLPHERGLVVRALPPEDGKARRRVEVSGTVPERLGANGQEPILRATVLTRRWPGDDLGWFVSESFPLHLERPDDDRPRPTLTWGGVFSYPLDDLERRLLVKELECLEPALRVSHVDPREVMETETVDLTIHGQGFRPRASVTIDPAGVSLVTGELVVVDDKTITLPVTAGFDVPEGPRDVTVTNPDGREASCPACLTVKHFSPPSIVELKPSEVTVPSPVDPLEEDVEIIGAGFRKGTSVAFSPGDGITVLEGPTVQSESRLHLKLKIGAAAAGFHSVSVTNPKPREGPAVKENAFEVNFVAVG